MQDSMLDHPTKIVGAASTAAPVDARLVALHAYWRAKAGDRDMPSRAEIDPAELKPLLPHIVLLDVLGVGDYRIRLMGEAIVRFVGGNFTGKDSVAGMEPEAIARLRGVLDAVVASRAPRFRAGKALWWRTKAYRSYEACFLPLSPANQPVNIILGGITFDT